jgi:hypothetical protein
MKARYSRKQPPEWVPNDRSHLVALTVFLLVVIFIVFYIVLGNAAY